MSRIIFIDDLRLLRDVRNLCESLANHIVCFKPHRFQSRFFAAFESHNDAQVAAMQLRARHYRAYVAQESQKPVCFEKLHAMVFNEDEERQLLAMVENMPGYVQTYKVNTGKVNRFIHFENRDHGIAAYYSLYGQFNVEFSYGNVAPVMYAF